MPEETPNKTARLFQALNAIGRFCGLPNVWFDDEYYEHTKRFHSRYRAVTTTVFVTFMAFEWAAFFTQHRLTVKQSVDRMLFNLSHPMLFMFAVTVEYHRTRIAQFQYMLTVTLKEVYNDANVEIQLLRNIKKNCIGFSCLVMMSLVFYGYDGVVRVMRGEGTFTTVIIFWPDVQDKSTIANVARVIAYLVWWMFMARINMVYTYGIAAVVCLSHQFKNVQAYFLSLSEIFEEDLEQMEKEIKYQNAFKVGIDMHSKTLRCTEDCQIAYNCVFSCQVMMLVAVLVLLMAEMVHSERTLESFLSCVTTGITILFSTGFFLWNAGDVTVEAAEIATTMYCSGWQNCHLCSPAVRRLVVTAMAQCQKPVIIMAMGIIELSYQSYVSIVKSSYSVFSVIF